MEFFRYGDEKGAAEMIFSYGFLESDVTDARQMFLSLDIPDDDPLKPAKQTFCDDAPGLRLFTKPDSTSTDWESDFVWWSCVNEEDGLEFRLVQSNDGKRKLQVSWKGEEVDSSERLTDLLKVDPLWDIFQLRAVMIVQDRVKLQLIRMEIGEEYIQNIQSQGHDENSEPGSWSQVWGVATRLRTLETDLLERGVADLEDKVRVTSIYAELPLSHP